MLYIRRVGRRQHLDHHFYHTGEFAEMASVSVRTLRFYDRVGLLSPTSYTEAGYRLYTERDFLRLQQILALKFLGFSLEEIKRCLRVGPTVLREALALQKAMMQERRAQLAAWGRDWSEEDQRVATQQWDAFLSGLQGLVAAGADPVDPKAQALAAQWAALISGFTHDDPGIQERLKNLYRNLGNMSASERPFPMPYTKEEEAFLHKMIEAYRESRK